MAESTVEVTQKEVSKRDVWDVTESEAADIATTEGGWIHVKSQVFVFHPEENPDPPESFTRATFESALDRVSRPVKGKYADVPYSSEDLIRDKRTEVELEDR